MSLFQHHVGRAAGPRLIRTLGLAVAAAVLVAGCFDAAASASVGAQATAPSAAPTEAPSAASEAPSVAPSEAASAAAGEAYEVDAASGSVGAYLTGEDGKTLYIFKKDSGGKSVCNGDCATNWPPFKVEDNDTLKAGTGVAGALAMFARDDGTKQVTYNGAPLYYFAGDKAAGDTTGQGIGGNWFVAAP
jgi:predicted lipoprotein with Yx(FWY)xxD motif